MHKYNHPIKPEYQQAVMKVQHYINQNLAGDVSLETLAGVANYSPFHFQKIFSAALLESPKQYVMRLRLERAAHYLKVFTNLPVIEIGMGCGFSSPSIFSRAFRNFYGVSAEEFRELSFNEISAIGRKAGKFNEPFEMGNSEEWTIIADNLMETQGDLIISPPPLIRAFTPTKIACISTQLSHPESISFAFKSLMHWAIPNDMVTSNSKFIGIWLDAPFYTSLNKCRYLAGIEIKNEVRSKKEVDIITMNEGKYGCFTMTGNVESTLGHIVTLNHKYLDEMGYEMAEIICYEIYDECPAYKPYALISKNIRVPVKAKRF